MSLATAKACMKGHTAWKKGDPGTAIDILQPVHAANAGLLDCALPLARALHESGQSEQALEILDSVLHSAPRGASIHRALIEFDLRDDAALSTTLEHLSPSHRSPRNRPAEALRALAEFRATESNSISLPTATLWSAEIAGRWVALLESRYLKDRDPRGDEFHHTVFCESAMGDASDAPSDAEVDMSSVDAWQEALERAFVTRAFDDFLALWQHELVQDGWREELRQDYYLYSLWATGQSAEVIATTERLRETERDAVEFRYLDGMSQISLGQTVEASWNFVRAAQLDDIQIDTVAGQLARGLEIKVESIELE